VLLAAVREFARRGGELDDLIATLRDLPPEASAGIARSDRLASDMADQLFAATCTDPLLGKQGTPMNPRFLLESSDSSRVRISVISLCGLEDGDPRRSFVEQLCMTLFSYIRRNPAKSGQPLASLLVLDEAKDFIPAIKQVIGKESVLRLAAQGRKYGLGMVFATQGPRSIDNQAVTNCSTQFYGKANAPAAIKTIVDQIEQSGGRAADIATLACGTFYVSSEASPRPIKVATPMCQSLHSASPPSETEVLERAIRTRISSAT